MREQKYLKEEHHRGEWIPLMINTKEGKKQAYAKITDDEAAEMNKNSSSYKIRYVLEEEIKEKTIKDIYTEEVGKKPFNGWSDEVVLEKLEEFRLSK